MDSNSGSLAPGQNRPRAKDLFTGVAATLLLFAVVMTVPVFGLLAGVFTPLPTLLVYYRWGSPFGWWVPGGSLIIGYAALLYYSLSQSLPLLIELLLLGFLLGFGMRRNWSLERTVGLAALSIFALGGLVFWMSYGGGIEGSEVEAERDLRNALGLILQQYGAGADKQLLEEAVQKMLPFLLKLMPGAALSTTLLTCWLNLLVTRRYCRQNQLPLPASWQEWSEWKAPDYLVWITIASGLVLLLPFEFVKTAGVNALMVAGVIYLLQGLAIVGFYFERWRLPRLFRAFIYGVILVQQFFTFGAILMGLFDMWIDFRRLSRSPSAQA